MEPEFLERLARAEERAKSNTHRIDKLEPVINEIHTMSNTMIRLVEEVRHTNETVNTLDEKIDRIDGRVDDMERAPAKDAAEYKKTAVTAVISTIAGAFATGLVIFITQFV